MAGQGRARRRRCLFSLPRPIPVDATDRDEAALALASPDATGYTCQVMDSEQLKTLIEAGIPDSQVSVRDLTGTRDHFRVEVISAAFADKSLVEQHQMVYQAVGQELTNAVHALSVLTSVPGD